MNYAVPPPPPPPSPPPHTKPPAGVLDTAKPRIDVVYNCSSKGHCTHSYARHLVIRGPAGPRARGMIFSTESIRARGTRLLHSRSHTCCRYVSYKPRAAALANKPQCRFGTRSAVADVHSRFSRPTRRRRAVSTSSIPETHVFCKENRLQRSGDGISDLHITACDLVTGVSNCGYAAGGAAWHLDAMATRVARGPIGLVACSFPKPKGERHLDAASL